jgi:hypothetical protein
MAFFSFFPQILYSTSSGVVNPKAVTNLLAKVNFLSSTANNTSIYYDYSVKDGERPEDIAYKMYKDAGKHWIILMSNNITDPNYDWVLSMRALEEYINMKYSSVTLDLDTTETYGSNYIVGEKVYQGSSIDKASSTASVVAYDSVNKKLTINFMDQVFANTTVVSGASSNVSHNVVSLTYNNDGYQWASNTTSHYLMTKVSYNNVDNLKTTTKDKVSAQDYNFTSNTIVSRNTNISYSNTYTLSDGSILTVETSIGPVSYYDYEIEQNEEKRKIIIINPAYVPGIEQELKSLLGVK